MLVENPQTNPQKKKKKKKSGLAGSQKHLCSCSINLFIAAWRSSLLIKHGSRSEIRGISPFVVLRARRCCSEAEDCAAAMCAFTAVTGPVFTDAPADHMSSYTHA